MALYCIHFMHHRHTIATLDRVRASGAVRDYRQPAEEQAGDGRVGHLTYSALDVWFLVHDPLYSCYL